MNKENAVSRPLALFKLALDTLDRNPVILYPLVILAALQLAILALLYFANQYPLSNFFDPLIARLWSERFLRYPLNLLLLPKLFYYAQAVLYLFCGGFLLAVAIHIVATVTAGKKISFMSAWQESLPSYIHVVLSSCLSFLLFFFFTGFYNALIDCSSLPPWHILVAGDPYIQFFAGIFFTALLIYMVPIIIIEKKKVFSAFILNFKTLFHSFWFTVLVVFLPASLYFPIIMVRTNFERFPNSNAPEIQLIVLVLGIFLTMFIDGVIATAVTIHYLSKKKGGIRGF